VTADVVEVQEVGEGDKAPPEWLGEIDPTFLSYEAVPLLNFPFFNEVGSSRPVKATVPTLAVLSCANLQACLSMPKHRSAENTNSHLC